MDREAALSEAEGGSGRKAGLVAAGGILAALAASSCCIMPLVLFALGVSGAWIGNLTALAPYQPVFIGITLASRRATIWSIASRRSPAAKAMPAPALCRAEESSWRCGLAPRS